MGDHDESDDGFIDQFENPFQRREYRRQSLDRNEFHENLEFWIKLSMFAGTNKEVINWLQKVEHMFEFKKILKKMKMKLINTRPRVYAFHGRNN